MAEDVLKLESRYGYLRIPIISWLFMVFPLVLPPIPLGPIQLSLSWDRLEYVGLLERAKRFIGRPRKSYTFPWGWMVNVMRNMGDMFSLGLRSGFTAAWLADQSQIKAAKSLGKEPVTGNVSWLLKWLFLGNVVFLIAWIIYPDWFLSRFVKNLESALYEIYHMDPIKINSDDGKKHGAIDALPAVSSDSLISDSRNRLVILGIYIQPLALSETAEGETLISSVTSQVEACAGQILKNHIAVYWCNLSKNYPTHYQQVGRLISDNVKVNGKWAAFRDGRLVCTATSASETIAKALGIPATIRAIDNMMIGMITDDLDTVKKASMVKAVILFVNGTIFPLSETVKSCPAEFLEMLAEQKADIFYMRLEKKGRIGDALKNDNLLWTGCSIWKEGQPVERIKMGWLSSVPEVYSKLIAWFSGQATPQPAGKEKKVQYQYRQLPCSVFLQWKQVIEASEKHLLVLASGSGMDSQKAESAFLRYVGAVFSDRGFSLAVAPGEDVIMEGTVAYALRTSGYKTNSCYVIKSGKVIGTIAESQPAVAEAGWLESAVRYLSQN